MKNVMRVVVMLAAVVMCAATSKKPTDKESQKVDKEAASLQVTVAEILANHDENALAWDEKFRGRIVEVTGVIKAVERAMMTEDPVVTLESPKTDNPDSYTIERVSCYLSDSQIKKATSLKVGDTLTVKGRVKGWSLGADISPCVLP